ncbi:MAG: acyl-CoA dehydrogenase family protein [Deltaproteobacteria bacterium]|nr:acyl-CoA dehydrogenase family protein [Deltaproteobacteria bacterium]
MDFHLSPEQEKLQQTARAFAQRECREAAVRWDREGTLPDDALVARMVELGWVGMCLPEAYGGGGQELLSAILCIEQLAAVSPLAAAPVFESNVGPVRVIELFGTEEQKRRWLPPIAAGKLHLSIGMTEPEAGSALTELTTRAEPCDGGYRLNGRKCFVTGGGHSGAYLVYCRVGEKLGAKGIAGFVVEKGTPGFSFGKPETFMGLRGFPSADLVFEDCVVPAENLIVRPGGFAQLMQCFDIERCGNATMALGLAQGALEFAVQYAAQRKTFGKPICDRQAIQMMVADMATRVDAARLLVYRAAVNAGKGIPALREASMAKVFANETAKAVTDLAMEILGGYGYSTEFPVERMLRDSRGWGIAGGTLQIQKIIIAAVTFGRKFDQRG